MNGAHIHLLLNHVPVIGTILGLLLLVVGMIRKSTDFKLASFGIFVISAIIAIPVYFTGEPAEETVEHLPGVSHAIVEQHEESAVISLVGVEILGILALIGMFFSLRQHRIPSWLVPTVLVLSVVTAGLMARTAGLGGQIRHTEIRSGATAAIQNAETQEDDEH